jgi:hypothetical protein
MSTMNAQRRLSMSSQLGAPATVIVRPLLLKPQWMNVFRAIRYSAEDIARARRSG